MFSRQSKHLPWAYLRSSGNFYHCHDCMWRMDYYWIRTMDRLVNHQHCLRSHQSPVCSNLLLSESWSVNIARTYFQNKCEMQEKKRKKDLKEYQWFLWQFIQNKNNFYKNEHQLNCFWPLVSLKVLQFYTQSIIFIVCQHVDIFIAQPEFLWWISKAILIVCPIAIEVFSWLTKVITSLNYLFIRW